MFLTLSRRFLGTLATSTLVLLALPAISHACGDIDFVITKAGPATVKAGQIIEYTIKVQQVASGFPVQTVVTDEFPSTLIPVSQAITFLPPRQALSAGVCSVAGNKITCAYDQIIGFFGIGFDQVDATKLTFQVSPTAACGTTITNIARVTSWDAQFVPDLNPANNTATSTSTVVCASPTPTPTPTPTPSPSISPTPTPTPTPTPSISPSPTPTPSVTKGLSVSKTDNRLNTRAGHSLTYVLTVKNTGTVDLLDVKVTDTLPAELTATTISNEGKLSGNVITWTNLRINKGESKNLTVTAKVKNISNCPVLTNKVAVKSADHNLSASAQDTTKVICDKQVAGVIVVAPVPVTAKTGAGLVGVFSTVIGAAGLVVLRKVA